MGHFYCDDVILSSPDKMNLLVVELWLQELLSSLDRGFTLCNFAACLQSKILITNLVSMKKVSAFPLNFFLHMCPYYF